ncbi:MAG: hypothetical protein Q9179_003206 [Wetmoreana sp. 5 TL-2023]
MSNDPLAGDHLAQYWHQTIIESLKYVTTGDMPPNSQKNGAFIHDPKLAGEKEVLAQAKLQFKDPSGAKMVVTRNVSVTLQKTGKPKQKSLEGSLLKISNGERLVISSRQAELDRFVPQYLGVSKAVLDNVVFCHQDESLWPMSEPGILKKKFDEIFEALKYTKAIDSIKDLRKHYMQELKELQTTEQNCKVNKDRADRVSKLSSRTVDQSELMYFQASKQSSVLSADIERLREEIRNLDKLAKEAQRKNKEAWDRSAHSSHVVKALQVNREKQEWLQQQIGRQERELKIRTESDEWLQNELDQYEERVQLRQEQKQQQANTYDQLRRAIETTREGLSRKHIEAGKYQQQQASHEQQIEARKTLVKDSARRHNIRGYEADLDDMQISEYMERISKLYKDQSESVERVRRETEKEMHKVQAVLNSLVERRSGFQEGKSSAKQQSSANDQNISSIQSELDGIEIDEGAKALSESHVNAIDSSLRETKDEYKQSSWDAKINDARAQLRSVEEEAEQTNQELVQSTKQSKDLARLEHLKKELSNRNRDLETLKGAHSERLRNILGPQWRLASLERDFHHVLDQRLMDLKESENRRNASSKDLGQTDFKLSSCREDLGKAEKELRECARIVTDATGEQQPESYHTYVDLLQQDRDTVRGDVEDFGIMQKLWEKAIKIAEGKGRCELCEREFHGHSEKSDFIRRMKAKIAGNNQKELEKSKAQLQDLEEELRKARSVGPNYSTWLRLSDGELPRLRSGLKQLEQSKASQIRKGEDHDKEVADREESRKAVESLSKPVANIVNLQADISNFTKQIEELSAAQKDAGFSRTIDEVQEQLESLNAQARTRRHLVDKLTSEKQQAQSLISAKELNLSKARNELSMAIHQLEKRIDLGKRIEDLRKSNREYRDTIRRLDNQIDAMSPQMSAQETKLNDIKQRGFKKEQELQQEASKLSDSIHKLRSADQIIQAYQDNGGSARLDRCQREIRNLQQEIEKTDAEQKQVTIQLNKINEELRDNQDTRRTITENLNYRQSKRDLEDVIKEIDKLSSENAEEDLEHHMQQQRYWEMQYNKHATEKTSNLATMKAKDNQLQELLKDWDTDFKNAAQEYKESHIKVETTKAAVEDLGRYGSALDKAIMQYHSLKMEEINRIAEELWKRTYQGTDVDSILIRSDNETARGNRSYNYRVCMIKQDAEMDMRGRCSAGQRVLASIIIRLALAECFGVKCGLIALDEPTTNLDRDNIRSLAESLHDIIRARQQQSNFQLIVITHDEEFLRYMKCSDFCDTYFRISRTDRQKSRIERQSITDVV